MGKAYVNRKSVDKRPIEDFYPTPPSLVTELIKTGALANCHRILEPACGDYYAISKELEKAGFEVVSKDLRITKNDFLKDDYNFDDFDAIVTNPPFSKFDDFVKKAKKVCPKVFMIGKTNFFGAYKRNECGIWKNLKHNYVFNRQVDYQSPYREDGRFHCGNLITGWFYWDIRWNSDFWNTSIIDVQQYVIPDINNAIENKLKKLKISYRIKYDIDDDKMYIIIPKEQYHTKECMIAIMGLKSNILFKSNINNYFFISDSVDNN